MARPTRRRGRTGNGVQKDEKRIIMNMAMLFICIVLVGGAMYLFQSSTGSVERNRSYEPREVEKEQAEEPVRHIQYDEDTQVLTVYFRSGPREDYPRVAPDFLEGLTPDTSPSAFYEEHIKGKLPFQ